MTVDLDNLFEAERSYEEGPPSEARARIREGVVAALALPQAEQGPKGERALGDAGGISRARAALGMLGTFAIGAGVGAAVMHATEAPSKAPAPTVSPVATLAPPASSASAIPPRSAEVVAPAHSRPSPSPPTAASAVDAAEAVAAERALLDAARVLLAQGEPQQALDLVERHAKSFPRGRLVEEREALAVRTLVKAGRYDEAHKRGASFEAMWPRSLAMPAVRAALESIP